LTAVHNSESLEVDGSLLTQLRQRRSAGESRAKLATEAGLTGQRLWEMLYARTHGCPGKGPSAFPKIAASAKDGPLTERYRLTSLDTLWGQEPVVKVLRNFVAKPHPAALGGSVRGWGHRKVAGTTVAALERRCRDCPGSRVRRRTRPGFRPRQHSVPFAGRPVDDRPAGKADVLSFDPHGQGG
jgi:hypothetical protein